MAVSDRGRAGIKFVFWLVSTAAVLTYILSTYQSGQLVRWYYYEARADGYAIDARQVQRATPETPVALEVGDFADVRGARAVKVARGDRLPEGTNGVIDLPTIAAGERVSLENGRLIVTVPWQIREAKGFKFRDGFTHKNIRTNPLAGAWNLVMVGLVGLCLGCLAEGLTDLFGLRFRKIDQSVGH